MSWPAVARKMGRKVNIGLCLELNARMIKHRIGKILTVCTRIYTYRFSTSFSVPGRDLQCHFVEFISQATSGASGGSEHGP